MKADRNGAMRAAVLLAGVAALAIGFTACEDVIQGTAITVTPETSELIGANASVVLTASVPADGVSVSNQVDALFLPLVWSVRNPAMGRIASSEGYSAVYVSSGAIGQNTVTVRDQGGASGVAAVNQTAPEEEEEEAAAAVAL